jgi:hypothetical protein
MVEFEKTKLNLLHDKNKFNTDVGGAQKGMRKLECLGVKALRKFKENRGT